MQDDQVNHLKEGLATRVEVLVRQREDFHKQIRDLDVEH